MSETAIDWAGVPARTVFPGFSGRFAHSETMTFALWDVEAGAVLPAHSHAHEQVVHVLEGRFEITIDGTTTVLVPGTVGIVRSNLVHSGRALTACRILDCFQPVRADYVPADAPAISAAG